MKIVGMIPARGGSSRFNNKPMALICGKPMVYWVWKHSKEVSVFDEVYVATDSEEIKEAAEEFPEGNPSESQSHQYVRLPDNRHSDSFLHRA